MSAPAPSRHPEQGFALLILLALMGVAGVGLLVVVERFVPPLADVSTRVTASLDRARATTRDAFVASGAFPADLAALVAADTHGDDDWTADPWQPASSLDYAVTGPGVRLRSRGPDLTLATTDDVVAVVAAEPLLRLRQRGRLRLLRAVFAASTYCTAPSMSPTSRATMRAALRDYAMARRTWLGADAATRTTLQTRLDDARTTVAALRTANACDPLPTFVVGPGGLMGQLGMPDAIAVDGVGATLLRDATVGVIAAGRDATGGTDDDM